MTYVICTRISKDTLGEGHARRPQNYRAHLDTVSPMSQWWELVIPAGAAVAGAVFGSLVQGVNDRRRYTDEAEERRKTRFIEERRVAYVRYLAALAEWEPLRAEVWRLREEMDHSQDREAAERCGGQPEQMQSLPSGGSLPPTKKSSSLLPNLLGRLGRGSSLRPRGRGPSHASGRRSSRPFALISVPMQIPGKRRQCFWQAVLWDQTQTNDVAGQRILLDCGRVLSDAAYSE
jgi:hypothetical protein